MSGGRVMPSNNDYEVVVVEGGYGPGGDVCGGLVRGTGRE